MRILINILEKLGIEIKTSGHSSTLSSAAGSITDGRTNPSLEVPPTRPAEHVEPRPVVPPESHFVQEVDVVSQLDQRAAASAQKLEWRTSIYDLLKLLEIDSSPHVRKQLADELHSPPTLDPNTVNMDVWLHKALLSIIAANGGNVPKDLID